ncbi:hypothetical protein KKA50_01230 [Patescibacteria group bacterium]|nr:hypothetical protein [Patescibacteria group bacterium]
MIELESKFKSFQMDGKRYFLHKSYGDLWVVKCRASSDSDKWEYFFFLNKEEGSKPFQMSGNILKYDDICSYLRVCSTFRDFVIFEGVEKKNYYLIQVSTDDSHRANMVRRILNGGNGVFLTFGIEGFLGLACACPTVLFFEEGKLKPLKYDE